MRHLISGEDCAIAGEATAAAAAPVAETFKKSRRFILRCLLVGAFFPDSWSSCLGKAVCASAEGALAGALTRKVGRRKRDKRMTALLKRKSNRGRNPAQAAAMTPWS